MLLDQNLPELGEVEGVETLSWHPVLGFQVFQREKPRCLDRVSRPCRETEKKGLRKREKADFKEYSSSFFEVSEMSQPADSVRETETKKEAWM